MKKTSPSDPPPPLLIACELRHAYTLLKLGRTVEARHSLDAAKSYSTHLETPIARAALLQLDGEIAIAEQRTNDAVTILEKSCNEFRQSVGSKSVRYTESLVSLAEAYIAVNQRTLARAVLAKVELDVTSQIGDRHPLAQQLQKIRNDTEASDG